MGYGSALDSLEATPAPKCHRDPFHSLSGPMAFRISGPLDLMQGAVTSRAVRHLDKLGPSGRKLSPITHRGGNVPCPASMRPLLPLISHPDPKKNNDDAPAFAPARRKTKSTSTATFNGNFPLGCYIEPVCDTTSNPDLDPFKW